MKTLALIALLFSTSPVFATETDMEAFVEICEITGEVKTALNYIPVEEEGLTIDLVVEGIDLQ